MPLLMKLDGSGTVLIDAVESRLKLAVEAAEAGDTAKADMLFANALEAENSSVERLRYLSQINS